MGTPVTLLNVWTLIYEYQNIADPTNTWRNTFDFFDGTAVPTATDHIVTSLNAFTNSMLHASDQSVKVSCYAWAKGRQPYPSGEPIFTFTQAVPGVAAAIWYPPMTGSFSPTGKEVVARIDHEPTLGGKPGRSFLRRFFGILDIAGSAEGDWIIPGGAPGYDSVLQGVITSTGLNEHLNGGTSNVKLAVVRYSPKTNVVHGYSNINSLKFIGVTTNRATRKNKK